MCPAPVFACPEFARELADVELQEIFRRAIGGMGDGRRVDCLAKRAILSRFQRRGWGKDRAGCEIGPQNGRRMRAMMVRETGAQRSEKG